MAGTREDGDGGWTGMTMTMTTTTTTTITITAPPTTAASNCSQGANREQLGGGREDDGDRTTRRREWGQPNASTHRWQK